MTVAYTVAVEVKTYDSCLFTTYTHTHTHTHTHSHTHVNNNMTVHLHSGDFSRNEREMEGGMEGWS